ncbi:methionine--tRNA ligase [bacterium]|uniref:Methionine--tRNA ligase n=2 Tax=Katanobacteria TaxID=422282 RepID=A0A2M7X3Q8_UNCKA|nr:methionine--tRNA ligase [bacterium]PIP56049.1 MAG: methionine--tRNA ligase [candidate division WWE3 bacterium CG22_combo_CG10-13_8_21_14_all_39_12]PJA40814.1 MAG: methionine--tRNA ligase [candidate division WWE3 bacterium CG_4_9_14_3_um_filter_39_7]
METITFEEFKKLDIKIGTVLSAEPVEKSEKLLRLTIDVGEENPRQIIAGLAKVTDDPQTLVGKQFPILTNLKPKSLMGLESQGMVLAANNDGAPVLMHPVDPVPPGSPIT